MHHIDYEHKCKKPERAFIHYDPCFSEPNRETKIPICHECNICDFLGCMSNLVLVHSECNKEINDVQLINYNRQKQQIVNNNQNNKRLHCTKFKTMSKEFFVDFVHHVDSSEFYSLCWCLTECKSIEEKRQSDIIDKLTNDNFYKFMYQYLLSKEGCKCYPDDIFFLTFGIVPVMKADSTKRRYMFITDFYNRKDDTEELKDCYIKTTLLPKSRISKNMVKFIMVDAFGLKEQYELFLDYKGANYYGS